ncbi:MAG: hypothetical protein ACLSGW_12455 [Clostridium sp.]
MNPFCIQNGHASQSYVALYFHNLIMIDSYVDDLIIIGSAFNLHSYTYLLL